MIQIHAFRIVTGVVIFVCGIACYQWLSPYRLANSTFEGPKGEVSCELVVNDGHLHAKYQLLNSSNGGTATSFVGPVTDFPEAVASILGCEDDIVEYRMDNAIVATLDLKTMALTPRSAPIR